MYEGGLVESMNHSDEAIGSGAQGAESESQNIAEATAVSKQTTETLMAGERIIEALDLADAELALRKAYEEAKTKLSPQEAEMLPVPAKNVTLAAYGLEPERYVLSVVEKISNTALLDALLVLPFNKVLSLIDYLKEWAKQVCPNQVTDVLVLISKKGLNIPLITRIMVFLLKTHHHQIVAHRALRTSLIPLRQNLRAALLQQKEAIGYNIAALRYLKRHQESSKIATFLNNEDTVKELREKVIDAGLKKRKRLVLQA